MQIQFVIRQLISYSDVITFQSPLCDMMGINHSKCAYWATIDGRESDLKYHISNGAELARIDPTTGRSLLHIACERGDLRCMELINQYTRGKHLNQMDKDENTPLNIAVYWNHYTTVCSLLKLGADPNYGKNITLRFHRMPQHIAASKQSIHMLHKLLEYSSCVDAQDSWGSTPLMVAISSKSMECVKLLLQHKASTDIRDHLYNATPLQIALQGRFYDVIRLLLDYGADTNVHGSKLPTPVIQALEAKNPHILTMLLEYGAKPNLLIPFANKLRISDLVEKYTQPRCLTDLCRNVLRHHYKWRLVQLAREQLSHRSADKLLHMDLLHMELDEELFEAENIN